jgi:type I restriction enzyme M protein
MPKLTEGDIKIVVNEALKDKGWILSGEGKNIWTEDRSQGNPADYVCYDKNQKPLIIIEVKRQGKDLKQALEQGIGYAKTFKAPLVIATDSVFTKCFHVNYQKSLTLDGEDFEDLLSEEQALKFVEQPHLITKEDKKILSRNELIKVFEGVNELLRHDVLQAGDERFSEFANLLFLKIFSEIEEKKLKNNELTTIDKEDLWSSFSQKRGKVLQKYVNDTVLKNFKKKYEKENLFIDSQIQDPQILEKIVDKLSPLTLYDTPTDVKGEAFEYFLKKYNSGKKDLGEYFTPRHIVKLLVFFVKPRFKEKIYDPFCGTGGILIEAFKSISKGIVTDDKQNKEILGNSIRGNEKTKIARIAKMNMILFGDGHNNIAQINTFQCPLSSVAVQFEAVITNIPFGFDNVDYGKNKYPIGCKYGDCLAIQHCLKSCKENGKVVIIMPEGFYTQKYKKYQETKKWIIQNYSIQAVVSLPSGTFLPYTGSKSSIIIIEKKKKTRNYFYYYQIKNDGFTLDNYRDKIEGVVNDIENLYFLWEKVVIEEKETSPLFTKIFFSEVEKNDYNLLNKKYNSSLPKNKEKEHLPLEEIAIVFHGCYELKKENFVSSGFAKVYRQNHAISGDFLSGDYYITEEKYQQLKRYEIQPNDIIMSISGTLGKVALVPPKAKRGIAWNRLAVFRIKEEWKEKILPEYLLAICQTPQMEKTLSNQSSGTTVQNVRMDSLKNFLIPVPSLEEQTKIIAGLNKIKQSIQNAQQIVDNFKLPLFVSLMKPIKKQKLGELATFEYGYTANATDKGEFRYLRITDIDEYGKILEKEKKYINLPDADKEKCLLNKGDIIVARIGATAGKTALYENNEKTVFASYLIRIKLNQKEILPEYYWCFAQTSEYWNQVKNLIGGTAQPQFNANSLKEIEVPIPSLENQRKAVEQLTKIKENFQNIGQTIDNLNSALSLSLSPVRLERLEIFA